ncbi:MAG: flagellar biosynthesis protein [Blautia sp.]|nr:flagellar biosynthesis protein [Blautia sp.]
MPEQLQKLINRISEWWKKFTSRQKALMLSLTAVVILALAILAVVMTRPVYVPLIDAGDYKEASAIKDILDADGTIKYRVSNTTKFEVDKDDESDANMLLGSNNYATNGYTLSGANLSDYLDSSFSTTEADKQKQYKLYLERKLAEDLAAQELINSATVSLDIAKDDGTLVSQMQESSASVSLDLNGSISAEQAYSIARFIATQLGNKSTDNVTILNQSDSKILYSGADEDSESTLISDQLDQENQKAAAMKAEIKDAFEESGLFSKVEVGLKLDMSFDAVTSTTHRFWHNDGMDTGEIANQSSYSATGTGSVEGVPGTTSNNDDTSYYTGTNNGEWSVNKEEINYNNNEEIVTTENKGGTVNYDNCSAAVVAIRDVLYKEEIVRGNGELQDMTWEEYKAAHADNTQVDVDPAYISMVAKVVGCAETEVEFICIERPLFVDEASRGIGVTDILQILLTVLIFALLGYVVFRSTRKQKEVEPEPELSVEALLESTAEDQDSLEDIGYSEKSETRLMIEKFVDENPDAAAILLRNWLNEDWE